MLILDPHARDTVARLEARGLFAGSAVTAIEPMHRRSRCYRLRLADGRSLFVKRRPREVAESFAASFDFEQRLTQELAERRIRIPAEFLAVAADEDDILVTEDLVGYATLEDRRRVRAVDPGRAYEIGRRLGLLHVCMTPLLVSSGDGLDRPRLPERLLRSVAVVLPAAAAATAGRADLAGRVRRAGMLPGLESAISGWQPRCIIHGDMRADNVLVAEATDAREPVVFVDWESAGLGDPGWDVGCLLGDALAQWIGAQAFTTVPDALDDWLPVARPALPQVRRAVRALIRGYESAAPAGAADRRQWMRFAALFLLERSAAASADLEAVPPGAVACLQLAERLALDPDGALELLS